MRRGRRRRRVSRAPEETLRVMRVRGIYDHNNSVKRKRNRKLRLPSLYIYNTLA